MSEQVTLGWRERLAAWRAPAWAALLFLTVLSYAPLIPWLGFYWDDWPYLWLYHLEGPAGFVDFVASDRPFSAWIFSLTTALFGERALGYHLLALALRWLCGVGLWWVMRQVWPHARRLSAVAAALFIVYPGFLQQPIALIYNHHLSVLALSLFSTGGMLWARLDLKRRWWAWAGSWLAAFSMFSIEYFIGLELLRPILLYLQPTGDIQDHKARLRAALRHWLPFLGVLILFLYWRVVIYQFPSYQPRLVDALQGGGTSAILALVGQALADLGKVVFGAWFLETLRLPSGVFTLALYAGVMLVTSAGAVLFLAKLPDDAPAPATRQAVRQILGVGLVALVVSGGPVWITLLPVNLFFPYDRLTMPFMIGAALVMAALIEALPWRRTIRNAVFLALVVLAVSHHFQNATTYRRDWDLLQSFFWQLSWRVPGLEPGTMILGQGLPLEYYSDNSLTAPLNWRYAQTITGRRLPYLFYNPEVRLKPSGLLALPPGQAVRQKFRSLSFEGSSSDLVVISYAPPGCVKVLDASIHAKMPELSEYTLAALPLSDLSRIQVDETWNVEPFGGLFTHEPSGSWCYYFELADLARQRGDWEQVAALGDRGFAAGDRANDLSELLVFVEGYAHTGNWERALELTEAVKQAPGLQPMACETWQRIRRALPQADGVQAAYTQAAQALDCPVP